MSNKISQAEKMFIREDASRFRKEIRNKLDELVLLLKQNCDDTTEQRFFDFERFIYEDVYKSIKNLVFGEETNSVLKEEDFIDTPFAHASVRRFYLLYTMKELGIKRSFFSRLFKK